MLVDCGSRAPSNYAHVVSEIERLVPIRADNRIVISHYHSDHYNLLNKINRLPSRFGEIYVPELPLDGPGSSFGRFTASFLALASIATFKSYRVLPELLKIGCKITPVARGDTIKALGDYMCVLWPDITHSSLNRGSIAEKAGKVGLRIQERLGQFGIRLPDRQSGEHTEDSYQSRRMRLIQWLSEITRTTDNSRIPHSDINDLLEESEKLQGCL